MSVLRFSDVFDQDAWKNHTAELEELEVTGVCLYTDGGYRSKERKPNASWGIHSYFYKEGKPAKASARYKLNFPTKEGYTDVPAEKSAIVTSMKIFNASGLIRAEHVTNNIGELQAFILALDIVLKSGISGFIKTVRILSDSEYVLDGANIDLPKWKSRDWKTSQGAPLANVEYWKTIDSQLKQIEDLNLDVEFVWRKGHEDFGNLIADASCTLAIQAKIEVDNFCDEEWYFSKEVVLENLMLEQKYLHFPGLAAKWDEYVFMFSLLDTKIPISHLGNRLEDLSISLLSIKDEDILDKLKLIHRECEKVEEIISPVPMVVDMKNMLSNKFNYFLINDLLRKLPRIEEIDKISINNPLDETAVLQVISPPRNSFKLLEEYQKAIRVLRDKDESVRYTDITEHIYKENEKKGGLEFTLKTEDAIEVEVEYFGVDGISTAMATLTIGLDLPRRRVLQVIAGDKPKISAITWDRGNYSFRVGVLVETENAYGFWLTPYGNTNFVQ